MVALGLSTFLGYFVRVPPRPPYALDNLRCRAAGRAFGMRDVASATSLIPNAWSKTQERPWLYIRDVSGDAPVVIGSGDDCLWCARRDL